jgi:hypothetical protein
VEKVGVSWSVLCKKQKKTMHVWVDGPTLGVCEFISINILKSVCKKKKKKKKKKFFKS